MTRILTLLLLLGAASLRSLSAAEIQLRESAQPRGAVVLLGDVAQVASNDQAETARLEALELFAVPVAGGKRFVRLREIQDALALRGEPLAAHAFSGANQVAVEAGRPDVSRKEP